MKQSKLSALVFLILGVVLLPGCSSDSNMSEGEQETVKNNMNRQLTPEEQAQMGGQSGPPEAPNKGD